MRPTTIRILALALLSLVMAQPARAQNSAQIALQQRDAGIFDRDVGARAHRDADVSGSERR